MAINAINKQCRIRICMCNAHLVRLSNIFTFDQTDVHFTSL